MCTVCLQGGDEIDDVFGCVIIDTNGTITVEAIDTYNIAGGGRRNIGDGDSVMLHVYYMYLCICMDVHVLYCACVILCMCYTVHA